MANFNLAFGFNWDATVIGTAVSAPTPHRPLQIGLVRVDDDFAAAYYRFQAGDILHIHIFNLGADNDNLSLFKFATNLDPDTGADGNALFSPALPDLDGWDDQAAQSFDRKNDTRPRAFGFSNGPTAPAWTLPGDPDYRFQDPGGPTAVELSAALKVKNSGTNEIRTFVGDPEMWIDE